MGDKNLTHEASVRSETYRKAGERMRRSSPSLSPEVPEAMRLAVIKAAKNDPELAAITPRQAEKVLTAALRLDDPERRDRIARALEDAAGQPDGTWETLADAAMAVAPVPPPASDPETVERKIERALAESRSGAISRAASTNGPLRRLGRAQIAHEVALALLNTTDDKEAGERG